MGIRERDTHTQTDRQRQRELQRQAERGGEGERAFKNKPNGLKRGYVHVKLEIT